MGLHRNLAFDGGKKEETTVGGAGMWPGALRTWLSLAGLHQSGISGKLTIDAVSLVHSWFLLKVWSSLKVIFKYFPLVWMPVLIKAMAAFLLSISWGHTGCLLRWCYKSRDERKSHGGLDAAQTVGAYMKPCVQPGARHKWVMHACDLSSGEAEAKRWGVQGHLWLCGMFGDNLNYVKLCFKKKINGVETKAVYIYLDGSLFNMP